MLVTGFYIFHTGWLLQTGALLINLGVLCYLANVVASVLDSKKQDVHAWFMIGASLWLFSTTLFGLLLVNNFTRSLLPKESLAYLSLHAHMGIIGWFLLLVIGVGARLIPMFLISKYTNRKLLWLIFVLINCSLISFILLRILNTDDRSYYVSLLPAFAAILLFGMYCRQAWKVRIRRKVDEQVRLSLLSIVHMLLPLIMLIIILALLPSGQYPGLILLYGFCIFFGWLTAIILGMTFKTLPFIVWNKVYHGIAHSAATPLPKDLFSERIFNAMVLAYLTGFVLFVAGISLRQDWLLKAGAVSLLFAASLYVYNTALILLHRPKS